VKVLLRRADNLRHQALSSILHSAGFLTAEIIETKPTSSSQTASAYINKHFMARDQSERDFFQFLKNPSASHPRFIAQSGELNSINVLEFIETIKFDMAITFGVSILKPIMIEKLRNQVLGIHLGLSPYYRGSGTNFFPFVNSELAAVGYTLMHLNQEIDKGPIVHQGRAPIVLGDSIHSIGNRNITKMFMDIIELIELNVDLSSAQNLPTAKGKLFKRADFTEDILKQALKNIEGGLVSTFISNPELFTRNYPIVQHRQLRVNS
jgi:folate-dependent phosphoribosylglycinamide formyltransferase PurN